MTGTMEVLDRVDPKTVTWDTENASEVDEARSIFDQLVRVDASHFAYGRTSVEEKPVVVKDFDPQVREYVVRPRMVGG